MEYAILDNLRRFSDEKMLKIPVFESDRLLFDQYCLRPGQSQRAHVHDDADKIYLVLVGEALVTIGDDHELLPEGSAAIARAGVSHGVRNDSDSDLVLLVVMAPKPQ